MKCPQPRQGFTRYNRPFLGSIAAHVTRGVLAGGPGSAVTSKKHGAIAFGIRKGPGRALAFTQKVFDILADGNDIPGLADDKFFYPPGHVIERHSGGGVT